MSRLRHSASWRQNKGKTGGGPFKNQRRFGYIRSLKYHRCDVGCQNRRNTGSNLKFCRIPAATGWQKKTTTAVVKPDKRADWTELSSKMLAFAAHTSYQKRLNKVLSFVVMDYVCVTCLKISYASHNYEIMSVCMCVKQQNDDYMLNHL